jgi:hypothetical protein
MVAALSTLVQSYAFQQYGSQRLTPEEHEFEDLARISNSPRRSDWFKAMPQTSRQEQNGADGTEGCRTRV